MNNHKNHPSPSSENILDQKADIAPGLPNGSGDKDCRILIKGGAVLSMDPKVGDFEKADVLIEGNNINCAPLNYVPGAVVTLMDRSNVNTVFIAGKIRKWRGSLLDVDLKKLRSELEQSRDYLFEAAGVSHDLFRS